MSQSLVINTDLDAYACLSSFPLYRSRDQQNKQDLSPDRIARLILHILFLENSKSVTLILHVLDVCVCGRGVGGGSICLYTK